MRVLFVCTGNICRSPTAEGVFLAQVAAAGLENEIEVDSAGTGGWHVGEPPDKRSQQAALRRGVDLSSLRARRVEVADFTQFDYLLAMDRSHQAALLRLAPEGQGSRVHLFLDHASGCAEKDVPDPYYGGSNGFDHVLDLIERGCEGLLRHIRQRYRLGL